MTRVAIVEDNTTVRQTLAEWIDCAPGFRCVCACANGKQAMVEVPKNLPDVMLMDIHLPGESGIILTGRLKALLPQIQVVIFTVYKDHDLLLQALKAGASGYLLKRSGRDDVLKAISEVRTGGAPMTGEIARMLVESFQKPAAAKPASEDLSTREMEILVLVSKGLTNKEISSKLGISFETVRNHLRHIYEKIHVHSRTEAVMKFHQERS